MGKAPTTAAGPSASSKPLLLDYDEPPIPFAGPSSSSFASEPLINKPSIDDALPSYDESELLHATDPPPFSAYTPTKRNPLSVTRSVIRDNHLCTDTEALFQHLQHLTTDIPHPLVHLLGTHRGYRTVQRDNKTRTEEYTVTDFSITLSLYEFLAAHETDVGVEVKPGTLYVAPPYELRHRGTRKKHSLPAAVLEDGKSIRDHCYDFVRSRTMCKEFSLTKKVPMDTALLKTHLERIIRSTNYRGNTTITFPVHGRTVTIAQENFISTARYTRWRYLFYVTFLWIITWPVLWVWTKRWAVVDAVFEVVLESEARWINEWRDVIATLVTGRREGTVTKAEMEGVRDALRRDEQRLREGLERRARGETEGVAGWVSGLLRGVADASQSIQGGWGMDEGSWGGGIASFNVGGASVRL